MAASTRNPRLPPVPILHFGYTCPPSPRKNYLDIRDGRREGPAENETMSLILNMPSHAGLSSYPFRARTFRQRVSQMPRLGSGTRDWVPSA